MADRLAQPAAPSSRLARADGDATRALIIETAGRLFAAHGYNGTTSKAICVAAGLNVAAINYHFGSRDGLYLALLRDVHNRLISQEELNGIADAPLSPPEKLRCFLRTLVQHLLDEEGWPIRVWIREILDPSPLLAQAFRQTVQPKFEGLSRIIGEITGLLATDSRIPFLVLNLIGPCLVLLIVNPEQPSPIQPVFAVPPEKLADQLWRFAMGGLRAVSVPSHGAIILGSSP